MATLILTAVGTAVSGPIGAAVGAFIGQQIDQGVFAPKGRQGPRLGELAVQTSNYGQPIPRIFGRMRAAGTVIWSTDLIETRGSAGGGKGVPRTTTYSYSASFAVALSARRINAVHRIWADGKLLRGEGGDWKSEIAGFRLYPGDEAQDADPFVDATEGAEGTPAYRGIAYAMFEGLQLADFGNRIPSLTFEIEADEAPPTLGAVLEALGGGDIASDIAATIEGYAASGDSVRGAIEALAVLAPMAVRDDGCRLTIGAPETDAIAIGDDALGARDDDRRVACRRAAIDAGGKTADEIAIVYYDPERDWQSGLQRARRSGRAERSEQITLPVAMAAGQAKGAAEAELARRWAARRSMTISVPWRFLSVRPGDLVALAGDTSPWRVGNWAVEGMAVRLALRPDTDRAVPLAAASGRQSGAQDRSHGPTTLQLIDLPGWIGPQASGPSIAIAAAGVSSGWRRAMLSLSIDGGASWSVLGETAAPAIMGEVVSATAGGTSALFDDGAIVVELLNDAMWIEGRSDDALIAGDNLARIGDELIQFGVVEALGARRFRLSRLLRGRGGSEWAMVAHPPGTPFAMIEDAALVLASLPLSAIGQPLSVSAIGIGDVSDGATATIEFRGRSVRPPAPVHVYAAPDADGLHVRWTRRSRAGLIWSDAETPLGEEAERYRVIVRLEAGVVRTAECAVPE
jgi:hypothetical protein